MTKLEISDTLVDAAIKGDEVEIIVKLRGRISNISNAHGLCAKVRIDDRDYIDVESRTVWFDIDEIQEIIKQ